MPRPVLPFHIIFTEYGPAWTVPVVNSIQLPAFSASSAIQVPPLELTSVWVECPVPLSVTARLSASKEPVVPPPPPPLGATSAYVVPILSWPTYESIVVPHAPYLPHLGLMVSPSKVL